MSAPDNSLIQWVSKQIADITEDGALDRLELYHAIDGEGSERCKVWKEVADFDALDLTQEIWDTAEHDASTRPHHVHQRYVVHAYHKSERDPIAVYPFTLHGRAPLNLSGSTELPNEKGVIANMLRHNETLHRHMMALSEGTAGRLARETEALRKRAEAAESQLLETFKLQQALLDRRQERELEQAQEQQRARRHDEMMGMLMGMAPLLLAKFLGKEQSVAQLPNASAARDKAVGQFVGNLSEEEIKGLIETLKPQNKLALLELYKSYQEDFQKEQASKPEIFKDGYSEKTPQEEDSEEENVH